MWGWIGGLWSWITTNAAVFSGLATVSMALIWAVYLQLLLYNFREGRRPELVINRCKGHDLNAHCILSNLSQGTAFVVNIIVRLVTDRGTFHVDVTDIGYSNDSGAEDIINISELRQTTRQGPLNKGEFLDAGRFGLLLEKVAQANDIVLDEWCQPTDVRQLKSLEILSIHIYGSQKHLLGARRVFDLVTDEQNDYFLVPRKGRTQQLTGRRQRLEVARWKNWVEQPSRPR